MFDPSSGPSHGEMQSAVEQAHGRSSRRSMPLWLSLLLAGLGVVLLGGMILLSYLGS